MTGNNVYVEIDVFGANKQKKVICVDMDTACSEQDIARIVCTLLFIDVSLLVNRCNLNNIRRSMKSSFTFGRTAEVST